MNQRQLESSIFSLHDDDTGRIVGSGFYVGDQRLVTCSQGVKNALVADQNPESYLEQYVMVEFPMIAPKQKLAAKVVIWRPDEKLAGLELLEAPPAGVEAAWLMETGDLSDHRVSAYGFSVSDETKKGWASGLTQNREENGRYYVKGIKGESGRIQEGHCGAAVWDNELEGIVGMIVMDEWRADVIASFLVPSDKLVELWDALPTPMPLAKLNEVPLLPELYVERAEETAVLKELLLSDKKQPVAMSGRDGWAGIGKTTVATAISRDAHIRRAFPDGVFWLDLGEKPDLLSAQSHLAELLDQDGGIYFFKDEQIGRDSLHDLFANKRCLIVLDDVWKAAHANAFDVQDTDSQTQLLIVTRREGLAVELGVTDYQIGGMSETDALNLLAVRANEDIDDLPEYAAEVAAECQHLPFALILAAGQAKDGNDWDDVLSTLQDAGLPEDVLDNKEDENASPAVSRFVGHPQEPNIRAIDSTVDGLSSHERTVYTVLSVFAENSDVPEATILMVWEMLFEASSRESRRLLEGLERKGLLNMLGESPLRHITFHSMHRLYFKENVDNVQAYHKNLLDAYKALCHGEGWENGPDDGYFYQNLPQHLLSAGRQKALQKLLLSYNWMLSSLNADSVRQLMRPYQLLVARKIANPSHKQVLRVLKRLSGPLSLREGNWADDLAKALANMKDKDGDLETLITMAKVWRETAWLRPLMAHANSGGKSRATSGHVDEVGGMVITSDGRFAISASSDRTIKIWDMAGGQRPRTLQGHYWAVTSLALLPDDKTLVSGSWDNSLKIWDIESGEELHTLTGHKHLVHDVAVSKDGRFAVSVALDQSTRVWNIHQYGEIGGFSGYMPSSNAVAISPDGKTAVVDIHKTLQLWDIASEEKKEVFRGHFHLISSLMYTPDGSMIISGSYDHTMRSWDITDGQTINTFKGHKDRINDISITKDGRYLASVSEDRSLKVWDLANGNEEAMATFQAGDALRSCAFAPDGVTIVAGDKSGRVHFLRLELPTKK